MHDNLWGDIRRRWKYLAEGREGEGKKTGLSDMCFLHVSDNTVEKKKYNDLNQNMFCICACFVFAFVSLPEWVLVLPFFSSDVPLNISLFDFPSFAVFVCT